MRSETKCCHVEHPDVDFNISGHVFVWPSKDPDFFWNEKKAAWMHGFRFQILQNLNKSQKKSEVWKYWGLKNSRYFPDQVSGTISPERNRSFLTDKPRLDCEELVGAPPPLGGPTLLIFVWWWEIFWSIPIFKQMNFGWRLDFPRHAKSTAKYCDCIRWIYP